MSNRTITRAEWDQYYRLRERGESRAGAARAVGISGVTAKRHESLRVVEVAEKETKVRQPIPLNLLSPEARRALNDFSYFQRRYFGRIATPWQAEAAEEVVAKMATPEKEYEVINAPPGSGKSTTFTLDIPSWLTVRNRALRGQIGSKTQTQARRYVMRLRRELERTIPWEADHDDIERGLALDAEATLAEDYGFFKPLETGEVWSADAFIVAQHGLVSISEKEPTWSAYGMDSGFLGMRYQFVVWDDVVDNLTLRTVDSRKNQQDWWDDVAEKRLEPGGLMLLQGQRMGAEDLYRYNLDKKAPSLDDEDEFGNVPKYHHIIFKAHYEDRCVGKEHHKLSSPYYPTGCLLDPRRLPWRELKTEMLKPGSKFEVLYQQEDVDPEHVLVNPLFIRGGEDPKTRIVYPGCWDNDRGIAEIPKGLAGELVSIASADPSPTKFWSIQWWLIRIDESGQPQERYLLDLIRQPMDAPDFLDWNQNAGEFVGVMNEWQIRSEKLNAPITTWIVEANAAQKFLLQYDHVKRWQRKSGVDILPHQTHLNKSDPDYGVQTIASHFQYGRVRLPGKRSTDAWGKSMKLVDEVTKWPEGNTDDCVMAFWFVCWNLPNLMPTPATLPRMKRPSWLASASTYLYRRGE